MPVCVFMSFNDAKHPSTSAASAASSVCCRNALKTATMLSVTDGHASCSSITAYSLLSALGAASQPSQSELYCHNYILIGAVAGFAVLLPWPRVTFFGEVKVRRSTRRHPAF